MWTSTLSVIDNDRTTHENGKWCVSSTPLVKHWFQVLYTQDALKSYVERNSTPALLYSLRGKTLRFLSITLVLIKSRSSLIRLKTFLVVQLIILWNFKWIGPKFKKLWMYIGEKQLWIVYKILNKTEFSL